MLHPIAGAASKCLLALIQLFTLPHTHSTMHEGASVVYRMCTDGHLTCSGDRVMLPKKVDKEFSVTINVLISDLKMDAECL